MRRREINPETVIDSRPCGTSQAVAAGGGRHVFVSGQVGLDADGHLAGTDLASQTEAALGNLGLVLEAAGGVLADVVSLRVYVVVAAADDLSPIGRALRRHFGQDRRPASTWLVVHGLAMPDLLVEVEAHAVVP